MNKSLRIVGGVMVFLVGSVALAILKELHVGGIVYGVAAFLLLIAFSRVTGWKYDKKGAPDTNLVGHITVPDKAEPDTQSSKVCPKCGKGYDRSWGMCLDCEIKLVDNETMTGNR